MTCPHAPEATLDVRRCPVCGLSFVAGVWVTIPEVRHLKDEVQTLLASYDDTVDRICDEWAEEVNLLRGRFADVRAAVVSGDNEAIQQTVEAMQMAFEGRA